MTAPKKPTPQTAQEHKLSERQAREQRLAETMRANLRKRKAAVRKASEP